VHNLSILFHHRIRGIDGQAIHVCAMLRAFAELGHRVSEVALVPHDLDQARAHPARTARRWNWITRLPRPLLELAEYAYTPIGRRLVLRAARQGSPDLVYARYSFGDGAAALACRRLGTPLVLEVNSPLAEELAATRGLSFPGLARQVERRVLRAADLVCAVSEALKNRLVEQGVDRARILVTPNGIDFSTYRDAPAWRVAARARLGVHDDRPILGFVGFPRAWHRLDWAIDALAETGLEHSILAVAGEGAALDRLTERARRLGVAERFRRVGGLAHQEIPAFLAGCDIGLLPGIPSYASPLKLPEYLAAGLAVVAPDQPNLREVVRPDEDALLFEPDSYAAFFASLQRLVADRDLRRRLAERARRDSSHENRQWTHNARLVLERLADLATRRGSEFSSPVLRQPPA
jgi:glycosyltransferase involved in cell wall biosynthesis